MQLQFGSTELQYLANMFATLSFVILASYIAYYTLKCGLLDSHSESYYALKKQGWLFPLSLALTAFTLLVAALEVTPEPFKFTAFLTCAHVILTAFAPKYKSGGLEGKVHFRSAKFGGVLSFIWAVWMAYSFTWNILIIVALLGIIFFILNKIFNKPILFLEYWIFTYPYIILLII